MSDELWKAVRRFLNAETEFARARGRGGQPHLSNASTRYMLARIGLRQVFERTMRPKRPKRPKCPKRPKRPTPTERCGGI